MINIGDVLYYKVNKKYCVVISHIGHDKEYYELMEFTKEEIESHNFDEEYDYSYTNIITHEEYKDFYIKSKKKIDKLLLETVLLHKMGLRYYKIYE